MSHSSKRKRGKKSVECDPAAWECTVCTYQNPLEAFKCDMCDTRKGTSTRKPKLSSSVVEQHTIVQNFVVQQEQQQQQQEQHQPKVPKKHSTSSKNANSPPPPDSATPTPSRSTRSVGSPSNHSFSSTGSADQSPSTSKNPTPQPSTPPPPAPAPPSPVPVSMSLPATPVSSSSSKRGPKGPRTGDPRPVRLRNIDKRSARSLEITVNGTTVVITDYKLKPSVQRLHGLKKTKSEPSGVPDLCHSESVPSVVALTNGFPLSAPISLTGNHTVPCRSEYDKQEKSEKPETNDLTNSNAAS